MTNHNQLNPGTTEFINAAKTIQHQLNFHPEQPFNISEAYYQNNSPRFKAVLNYLLFLKNDYATGQNMKQIYDKYLNNRNLRQNIIDEPLNDTEIMKKLIEAKEQINVHQLYETKPADFDNIQINQIATVIKQNQINQQLNEIIKNLNHGELSITDFTIIDNCFDDNLTRDFVMSNQFDEYKLIGNQNQQPDVWNYKQLLNKLDDLIHEQATCLDQYDEESDIDFGFDGYANEQRINMHTLLKTEMQLQINEELINPQTLEENLDNNGTPKYLYEPLRYRKPVSIQPLNRQQVIDKLNNLKYIPK